MVPFFMLYAAIYHRDGEPVCMRMVIELCAMILFQTTLAVGMLVARAIACRRYDPNDDPVAARLAIEHSRAVRVPELEEKD